MNNKIVCEKSKWELIKDSLRNHFLFKFITKFSESGSKKKMAIICDVCNADVTPDKNLVGSDMPEYEVININGKICLCHDCYCALADFVRSDDFKKVVTDYKKQFESERE